MILEYQFEGLEVCSTNSMYIPTKGKGKKGAYLRKSPYLIKWQTEMKKMFDSEIFHTREELEEFKKIALDESRGILFYLKIGIPISEYATKSLDDLKNNDTSNMIKAIEDCFATNIGLDDKYNITIVSQKGYTPYDEWKYNVMLVHDEPGSIMNEITFENDKFYKLGGNNNESDT